MGADLAPEPVAVPGYVVGDRIGAGGFGEVFRARHTTIGREVAIKVLHAKHSADPQAVARFIGEARAVNQIAHASIVEIFDVGELADGRAYCVMELLRGRTLRELLDERGHLPLAEALPVLRAIAGAIDAAHAHGIAHRDLKPDNVFITGDGVKLIDFGLAKLTREEAAPVTETGAVFGTPMYMSPEQCRGKASDPATDRYSFGAVAYHVLAGAPPFEGDALALALHHIHDVPAPPSSRRPELPARVDRVVLALLAKTPSDRPQPLVAAVEALAGTTKLPRRLRLRWLAVPVVAAAGALALARTSKPARDDACPPGQERVAGLWSDDARDKARARFAAPHRADVSETWERIDGELATLVPRWATAWDAACHAPDRATDQLLYAQRLTCLDEVRDQIAGQVDALDRADPVQYALVFVEPLGPAIIERCDDVASLRGQGPLPSVDRRPAVARLTALLASANTERRAIVDLAPQPAAIDALDARYAEIVRALDALDPPSAAKAAAARAELLAKAARADTHFAARAKAALDDAAQRAETARADDQLLWVADERVALALAYGEPDAVVDAAVARAAPAIARLGAGSFAASRLAARRAEHDARHGRLAPAIETLRAAIAPYERARPFVDDTNPRRALIGALLQAGRGDEAVREARAVVEIEQRAYGPHHLRVLAALELLAHTAEAAGDLDAAIASWDRMIAGAAAFESDNPGLRDALRDSRAHRLATLAHAGRAPDDLADATPAEWTTWAATLAAEGRLELLRARGIAPPAAPLAELEALATAGKWSELASRATAQRTATPWLRSPALARLDTLIGRAKLELGDPAGALDPLEQALATLDDCCDGFHEFAPALESALSRALAATGGDPKRIAWLADRARTDTLRAAR